jgi:hypothetical protein
MKVKEYSVQYEKDYKGTLTLDIEHNDKIYEVEFEFVERTTEPHENSPFPTGDSKKYAWPSQEIPKDIKFEVGTDEAIVYTMGSVPGVPEEVELLKKQYGEVENVNRSPFVKYQ